MNDTCPSGYIMGECENGHQMVRVAYCGKDWCPVCGERGSPIHLRRVSQIVPKLLKVDSLGYFVFTIPEGIRHKYRTKAGLNYLVNKLVTGQKSKRQQSILQRHGFSRAISRWHWFGEESMRYNPHLNVLVDGVYLSEKKLEQIKREWKRVLGLKDEEPVSVYYEYGKKVEFKIHVIYYVTRATFLDRENDIEMADRLKAYRNTRQYGWIGYGALPDRWKMERLSDELRVNIAVEKGLCPICGGRVKWSRFACGEFTGEELYKIVEGLYLYIDQKGMPGVLQSKVRSLDYP